MTTFQQLESQEVVLRPMRDEQSDYERMGRWLSDERVLAFYGGRDHRVDAAGARKKYRPRTTGEESVNPCIIERFGEAVGYLQYYRVEDFAEYGLDDVDVDTWGVDLFVGEPRLWSTGLGSSALRLIVEHLFEECDAERIVIDPHVDNRRAIRAYEKCGFEKVKVLKDHEQHDGQWRDAWLMELRR